MGTKFEKGAIDSGLGDMLKGLLRILNKHKLPAPQLLPIMAKFNLLVDGLAHQFCPDMSTADMLREEFMALSVGQDTKQK